MVTLLVSLWVFAGFQEGDRWTTERTIQLTRSDAHVDSTTRSRITYRVVRVEAAMFAIQTGVAPAGDAQAKPLLATNIFKPSGALVSKEDTSDLNLARIQRMEWTALEERKGISWSRSWTSSSNLIEAKVTVKPTARTPKDTTLLVTYDEGGVRKGTGTIKVLNDVPVIEELRLTLNKVEGYGSIQPETLTVIETLKEIHIGPN